MAADSWGHAANGTQGRCFFFKVVREQDVE